MLLTFLLVAGPQPSTPSRVAQAKGRQARGLPPCRRCNIAGEDRQAAPLHLPLQRSPCSLLVQESGSSSHGCRSSCRCNHLLGPLNWTLQLTRRRPDAAQAFIVAASA